MSKIEVFSKKKGKTLTVKSAVKASTVMGWSNSAWQKSSGWKRPVQ